MRMPLRQVLNLSGRFRCLATVIFAAWILGDLSTAFAQRDRIYLVAKPGVRNTTTRGKVVKTSPFAVTVETDSGNEEIPASQIRKISFDDEPREVERARDHIDGQRYEDCLETLSKMEDIPESEFIRQQIRFLRAFSTGQIALRGGAVTLDEAEQLLGTFVKSDTNSHQLVVAVDLYGQILLANGKLAQAQKEFNKLTKSKWDSFVMKGFLREGETLLLQNQLEAARASYEQLSGLTSDDPESKQFSLLAKCQLGRISAMSGNAEQAIASIQQIIADEDASDSKLFACAYNALGVNYLQAEEPKKARLAFLHTHLLFSSEPDAHAEALFHLTKLWSDAREMDRANEARALLTSRYRSSVWASRL